MLESHGNHETSMTMEALFSNSSTNSEAPTFPKNLKDRVTQTIILAALSVTTTMPTEDYADRPQ